MMKPRILLLIANEANRRLLAEWLSACTEGICYEVLVGELDDSLDESFDLGIVDGPLLGRLQERIEARRRREEPAFLPFLLVAPRRDLSLATRYLWKVVDDVVTVPIQKMELQARVEALLRPRRLSLELRRETAKSKQAEEILRRTEAVLRQAGQITHLGAWEIVFSNWEDLDANPLWWSDEAYRIFGYEPGEVAVSNDLFFQRVCPEDRPRIREAVAQAFATKQPYSIEHCIIRPDGTRRTVLEHAEISFDDHGRPIRIIGAVQDITELKQTEEQREQLLAEVQRRAVQLDAVNKELEAFTYSVSHDLRAPLRHLDGFSKILLRDYSDKLDEQGKQYLQFVRNDSERMSQLIDDLLKLSRLTTAEMHRENVNLSEVAESIERELREEQPERQVDFIIQPGIMANGDPHLLRVVLENLLRNAWKFTSKRELARIEFGVLPPEGRQDGQEVYFVRDNGAGFDMTYADKLFTPFQRLHKQEEFPGIGIGLATVQRIIRRHGGRVWAEGEVGKGATFYFTLG